MRDTVLCLINRLALSAQQEAAESIDRMVRDVAAYVPGYRLKQAVQSTDLDDAEVTRTLNPGRAADRADRQQQLGLVVGVRRRPLGDRHGTVSRRRHLAAVSQPVAAATSIEVADETGGGGS
jgi:hypothetical protein